MSSDPGHRPQSTRVHNISAQVARSSIVPAGRVFSLQATRLVSSTRRPAVSSEATTPRSPGRRQPGLEAVAAVLHGQAGPALYSIYTYHNERHPIGLLSLYMQQRPLPGLAPAWVKGSRYPTHRLRGGDDGLPIYRSSAVLGASKDISPSLHPKEL
jgi:hypothetical protein